MPQLLSPTENGDFKLEHFEVRNEDIRAILSGVNPGNYVRLMHRGEINNLRNELERMKSIMREHGIMTIPSAIPGGKSSWNVPSREGG